jgi:hypothetical protein
MAWSESSAFPCVSAKRCIEDPAVECCNGNEYHPARQRTERGAVCSFGKRLGKSAGLALGHELRYN